MSRHSKILTSITAGVFLSASTAAVSFANQAAPNNFGSNNFATKSLTSVLDSGVNKSRLRFPNASETASHYFRVGVKNFNKGNLKRAEEAFNAVLRADGLDYPAHYYLAKIKLAQGDRETAAEHALAVETFKEYYEIKDR